MWSYLEIRELGQVSGTIFIKYESKLQDFHENRELQIREILEVSNIFHYKENELSEALEVKNYGNLGIISI